MNLKIYLKNEWNKNNHTKYHKYFDEWFKNLTENQIYYFENLWFKN